MIMKRLSSYLKDDEILTFAQFYERVHNKKGSYCDWIAFEGKVQNDKSIIMIPNTKSSPIMIKKRKTFFEKILDFLRHL